MKFLKNKSIVIVLVLVAIGFVSKNIILPIFHSIRFKSSLESNAEISQQEKDFFEQDEYTSGVFLSSEDYKKLGWVINYARDPFKVQAHQMGTETVSSENGETPSAVEVEGQSHRDALVAVVQESGTSFAVINDKIVGVGDYYKDYRVIRIDPDSVTLKGPGGYRKLEF